ncbi:gamma-type small acid-soluble spore protein [Laceyella putida]|uniref:Small, acid-soluble spore protein gamma-type n=1 Tax=Laceyella putida TaxID=110101 RepID=A0ABW2RK11_9BACL
MDTKNFVPQQSKTNSQQIRQKNQQSAQAQPAAGATAGGFATEFASETNAQQVRQQNQQSQARKSQNQQ